MCGGRLAATMREGVSLAMPRATIAAIGGVSRTVNGAAVLKLEQCDGTTRADEIKALFVRNDRPGFPDFFDRVYPSLAAEGGASWIGVEDDGSVVMHVAVFPRTFRHGGRTWS